MGSPERIKHVATLIQTDAPTFVVLSAMSATTNTLLEIAGYLYNRNPDGAIETINRLEATYNRHLTQLFATDEWKEKTREILREVFNSLHTFTCQPFGPVEEKILLAQGEIMSTNMMTNYLHEQGVPAVLLSAFDFMRLTGSGEPDLAFIKEKLN